MHFRFTSYIFVFYLFLLFAIPVFAIEYGGVGGRPAYPREEEPKSDNVFIHNIKEGQIIKEGIKVLNNTNVKKVLMVYPADYVPSSDGGFACKQRAEENSEVGTWINLDKEEVTLNPMESEIIDFTINVPESGLSAGEHNGCVLVQEKKPEVKDKPGVNLSIRTGLRVLLTLPGELIRKLEILSFTTKPAADGKNFLIPEVHNSGNVSIDADVKVVTSNILGMKFFEHGGIYSILKNDTARWNFELPEPFWGGIYRSVLTVKYNNGEEDITLTAPNTITLLITPTIPAILIMFFALLPFILLILFMLGRRGEKKSAEKNWMITTVTPGDTLMSIASKFNVSWKKLARVNNIKAPYSLSPGDQLLVPPRKANNGKKKH